MSLTIYEIASRLAYHLGLYPPGRAKLPDTDKVLMLLNDMAPEDYAALSCFAARFLPSFIAAYQSTTDPQSPYRTVMVPVVGTAYFGKFLRNTPECDLGTFHAQLVVQAKISELRVKSLSPSDVACHENSRLPEWDKESKGNIENVLPTSALEDVCCIF
ncbi:hypothetical protein C8R46DRAFT_1042121 [Mycena filopes]|nr:hypothetical protein C8R46DRAFT_1042121 [Mycena filopes]